jgi:hypothetical protein
MPTVSVQISTSQQKSRQAGLVVNHLHMNLRLIVMHLTSWKM